MTSTLQVGGDQCQSDFATHCLVQLTCSFDMIVSPPPAIFPETAVTENFPPAQLGSMLQDKLSTVQSDLQDEVIQQTSFEGAESIGMANVL